MMSFEFGPNTASIVFGSPDFAAVKSPLPASSGEANTWYEGLAALLHPTNRMSITNSKRRFVISIMRVARNMPILQDLHSERLTNAADLTLFAVAPSALVSPATTPATAASHA